MTRSAMSHVCSAIRWNHDKNGQSLPTGPRDKETPRAPPRALRLSRLAPISEDRRSSFLVCVPSNECHRLTPTAKWQPSDDPISMTKPAKSCHPGCLRSARCANWRRADCQATDATFCLSAHELRRSGSHQPRGGFVARDCHRLPPTANWQPSDDPISMTKPDKSCQPGEPTVRRRMRHSVYQHTSYDGPAASSRGRLRREGLPPTATDCQMAAQR
jgi:hypothetical protein